MLLFANQITMTPDLFHTFRCEGAQRLENRLNGLCPKSHRLSAVEAIHECGDAVSTDDVRGPCPYFLAVQCNVNSLLVEELQKHMW